MDHYEVSIDIASDRNPLLSMDDLIDLIVRELTRRNRNLTDLDYRIDVRGPAELNIFVSESR